MSDSKSINVLFIWLIILYVTGENCTLCLQLHSPSACCLDGVLVIIVIVSTNHSHLLHENITLLLVNDKVCNGNDSDNDVVEYYRPDDNIDHSYSFILTTVNSSVVTIRAHTIYYGANWYSTNLTTTIEECRFAYIRM